MRRVAIAIAMLTCVGMVGGCSRAISGTPTATPMTSATQVAGKPATDGPSGVKPGIADATLPVDNTDHGNIDKLAVDAVSDLDDYWRQAFPQSFGGKPFPQPRRLVSYDSGAPAVPLCNANSAGQVTAFYCLADDSLDWDRGRFLPTLDNGFGSMAVVSTLAHAMGHAVELRAGTVPLGAPAIVAEQQADCFTGAFLRSVVDSPSRHFQLSTGNGLSQVMGALSFVRDAAPGNSPGDDAHGSALDRTTAFELGFTSGSPKSCAQMDANTVGQRTGQSHFWTATPTASFPITAGNLGAVESSLLDAFRSTGTPVPTIMATPGGCASVRPTTPASYCPDTNTVSLDVPQLQQLAQQPMGSFAAYADVASRYALSVQKAAGLSLADQNASLRTGCLVGAWSGVLVDQPLGGRNRASGPRMAPDDVDAVVAELLAPQGLAGANVAGMSVPAGFARVDAFRAGFEQGITGCAEFG